MDIATTLDVAQLLTMPLSVKEKVGDEEVILGLSGGVILHAAASPRDGDKLTCVF